MRSDERLRAIYEVMAPYIVRNEHNWRDYLAFASQFHKHSFDNILLVYAQDENVSILATKKQWAGIGRNLIHRAKGIAVCVYRNARLTLDYLFDVSQTIPFHREEVILLRLCGEAFSAKHRAKFSEKLLSIHLVLPPES